MRTAMLFALAVAGSGLCVACHEPTAAPTPAPDLLLTGRWRNEPDIPVGDYTQLDLRASGERITGTWHYHLSCRLNCGDDYYPVSGDYSDTSRSFALSIRYSDGSTATFVGQVFGADSLNTWRGGGPWTETPLMFYRLPVPPCADSTPLLGAYDPAAPGYIVQFHDSVNAAAEAARLAAVYGFTTRHVYEAALKGFAAQLSPATVTVLRCEPTVASIEYDGVVTTNE